MSTRNNRYEEDYVVDGNTVRRRKQPSLESDNESWGVPALPRLGSKARSDGSALGGENSRRVASRRRNRNRRNVPTDDLGRFDHYMRVGLPSQFFYHYNRLLRYELDLIKRLSTTQPLGAVLSTACHAATLKICLWTFPYS